MQWLERSALSRKRPFRSRSQGSFLPAMVDGPLARNATEVGDRVRPVERRGPRSVFRSANDNQSPSKMALWHLESDTSLSSRVRLIEIIDDCSTPLRRSSALREEVLYGRSSTAKRSVHS